MKLGDMPRRPLEQDTAATEVVLTLSPGRYEWWIEALFDHCYGTQSAHRLVAVVE